MEVIILMGIQGSGKSTFYRERFFQTHVRLSLDVLKTRHRERAFLQTCLTTGQPCVIDNTNMRAAERAVFIAPAKKAGFRVKGYFLETPLRDALRRNAQRSGDAVVPVPGVIGTLKRLERPSLAEGFDELYIVTHGENGQFIVNPWTDASPAQAALPATPAPEAQVTGRHRIFLLSPANVGGERGRLLLRPGSDFDLAVRLRGAGVPLGEAFAFVSGLYFRGKLAYAQAFAEPPEGIPGSFVITSGYGLMLPETVVTIDHLRHLASVPIDAADPRYRIPLERSCSTLDEIAGPDCDYVLLGSVATLKYLDPIFSIFRDRLLFPAEFVGRGDMSRGGMLLRCVRAGVQLNYTPLGNVTRHGPRPPKLPRMTRPATPADAPGPATDPGEDLSN